MGNSHRGFESHALRMGRLLYGVIASLDGYVNDTDGRFGWAEPDAEVHAYVNDLMRPVGTHLYGRRLRAGGRARLPVSREGSHSGLVRRS